MSIGKKPKKHTNADVMRQNTRKVNSICVLEAEVSNLITACSAKPAVYYFLGCFIFSGSAFSAFSHKEIERDITNVFLYEQQAHTTEIQKDLSFLAPTHFVGTMAMSDSFRITISACPRTVCFISEKNQAALKITSLNMYKFISLI